MAADPPAAPDDAAAAAFWRFSLDLYGRPGVAEACLGLQERRAADVNVLLLILWRAGAGHALDDAGLKRLSAVSRDWQAQVVGPVRQARRAAKRAAGADLYARLKETELACEKAEQAALVAALGPPTPSDAPALQADRRRLAELDLRSYLDGLPGSAAGEEEGWVTALVFAAFP